MRINIGFPIPDLSTLPGPSRPGFPVPVVDSYSFKFEVAGSTPVQIKANAAAAGNFRIKWPNGTTDTYSGNNASIAAPDATAGIVSINDEKLDTTYVDEFAVVGGKTAVTKVISWGTNSWNKLVVGFENCTNLIDISTTSLITDTTGDLSAAFRGCTGLTEAVCKNWNLSAGAVILEMFGGCTNLTKLDFTGVNMKISSSSKECFEFVGSATTDGCEFLFSGLDLSTWSYTGSQNFSWFKSTKIKPTSTFKNWIFNPSNGPNGFNTLFASASITGTNSTLDISGWSSYSGNSMVQWFQNFNSTSSFGDTGLKINVTNLSTINVATMYFFGWKCGLSEFVGLNTLGANTGYTGSGFTMESAFREMNFLKLSGSSSNFGNTFTSSIKPNNLKSTFNSLGVSLNSNFSEAPLLSNLDASLCGSFQNMFLGAKLATMPSFSTFTFPTTATTMAGMFAGVSGQSYSGSHLDFSNVTMKPSTFSSTFSQFRGVEKVTLGNNVDLSECTIFTSAFFNAGTTTEPLEVILPTNADYSTTTNFVTAFKGLDGPSTGNPPLTTCVADTLMRRLFATQLTPISNVNLDLTDTKITGSPSVVNSHVLALTAAGWVITDEDPDAVMPFVYTTPIVAGVDQAPTGSFANGTFSSSDAANIPVNATTGLIDATNAGSVTIRYTITATGCYNEQALVVETPLAKIDNVYSMEFDGLNDSISLGNSTITGTTYSVSLWFKSTEASIDRFEVLSEKIPNVGSQFAYRIYIYTSGNLELLGQQTSGTAYNDGQWHNVVIIQDPSQPSGKTGRGFVDGSLVTERDSANNTSGSSDFFIGSRSGTSNFFKGQIDEVAVFNYALTDEEILDIYNSTVVVGGVNKTADLNDLTTPPIKWYRMGD